MKNQVFLQSAYLESRSECLPICTTLSRNLASSVSQRLSVQHMILPLSSPAI